MNRDELLDKLSNCPPGIFRKVVTYLKPPAGTLSSEMSSQAIRAAELLEWTEHLDGLGIEELEKCYRRAIGEQPTPSKRSLREVILTSLLISGLTTSLVIGMRWQGKLQTLELQAFDLLMRQQPIIGRDKRLVVVRVTSDDTEHLNQPPEEKGDGGRTLSDSTLDKLLEKLNKHQPRVIGLDIFREGDVKPDYVHLETSLREGRLIAVCKGEIYENNIKQRFFSAPNNVPKERIGFADLAVDQDDVTRRHLLLMGLDDKRPCKAHQVEALSLKLALSYLKEKGITRQDTEADDFLKIGTVKFSPLKLHTGGYHHPDSDVDGGIQVMLNYRPYQRYEKDIARVFSLTEVLSERLTTDIVKDRIVLIGVDELEDRHKTPFSRGTQLSETLPGVFVHAQMVSHILDIVEGKRPLIWTWPLWGDALWLWGWSLVGGLLAWVVHWRSLREVELLLKLGFFNGVAFAILYGLCWGFLMVGGWISLVPSVIDLLITSVSVAVYALLKPRVEQ
ncbi:MAG: CHASE2 domain-containing protein [Coleofasciculus sp. S288]|nr:CHASE2 domain-containing protein [Coleofasciculus sp. S288]